MTLVELKQNINTKILPHDFMIFVCKDADFLIRQYIQALGKLAPNGIRYITSIYEPLQSSSFLLTSEGYLNVLIVDTFDERSENYIQFQDTIVLCNKIDKTIAEDVKDFTIVFPKLEGWQIADYIKTTCECLDADEITWLQTITNNNIERIENELSKVTLFEKHQQKDIFNAIRFDPYSDLYQINFFNITNALVDGNRMALHEFLSHKDYETIDPVGLANTVMNSIKNIILVTQNPFLSAADIGISTANYNRIRYNYGTLDIQAARAKLTFLVQFDLDLKTSKLDMSKQDLLNYLISHLAFKIKT